MCSSGFNRRILLKHTPEDVAEIISQHPKKKVRRKATDVKAAMEKNGEILIEGQIPGSVIAWAN